MNNVSHALFHGLQRWVFDSTHSLWYGLRGLLSTLEIFVSVLICYGVLACLKVGLGVVGAVGQALWRGPLARLLESRATLTVALSGISLFGLAMPSAATSDAGVLAGSVVRVATYVGLLALLQRCGSIAMEAPASLSEIRERAKTRRLEEWVSGRMTNPLDSVWLRPLLVLSLLSIPAAAALVNPVSFNPFTVIWYGVVVAVGAETIATFEHGNGHYRFFRLGSGSRLSDRVAFGLLRLYFEHLLDLLFARIPRWYEVEHVLVHHAEDNGPADLQSTLPYDRASFIDFARCANRFALSGLFPIDVLMYLWRQRRVKGLLFLLGGLCTFYGALCLLAFWSWKVVLVLLAFRYATLVIGTMGFFHEHGMIDTSEPLNNYRNSLHYINEDNSHASLGEDPHIEHHLHPGRHWSEYAHAAKQDMKRYAAEKSLGFLDGPGRVALYYRLIWQRDYLGLARLFVVFGAPEATHEEVAALLKARTRPLGGDKRSAALRRMDLALGRGAGYLLL